MNEAYTKLMLQQHTSEDAAFYKKLENTNTYIKRKPVWKAVVVAVCILLLPMTVWAAESIFGATQLTVKEGKDLLGKDAIVFHWDLENVEHIPLAEFSHHLQELKESEWVYFDSWEDAEESIGIDFISNTLLTDEQTQPYARKKKHLYDERRLAYANLNTKLTPYQGIYYAFDEQLFAVSFSAEYCRNGTRFMITANMTTDHPLMTEETFLVYHGMGEQYCYGKENNISAEQYITGNGIPVTIYSYTGADLDYSVPTASFSVNNVSYHVQITQWSANYDEETAKETNERLYNFVKEILEGFTVE